MNFQKMLAISRPRFWVYTAGTFAVGVVAAIQGDIELAWWEVVVWGVYWTLPANLLLYGLNDMFDYETDIQNPKKQHYEKLLYPAERPQLLQLIGLTHLPWLLLAWVLPQPALWGLLLFWVLGAAYSVPPLRLKIRHVLDSLSNGLYIMPGVMGFGLIASTLPSLQAVVAGIFWCMAMHAFSAVPDIAADRRASLRTIATELGGKRTVMVCLVWYGLAAGLAWPYLGFVSVLLGFVYVAMMAVTWYDFSLDRTFRIYRWFPSINTMVGMVIFLTALISSDLAGV